MDIHVQSFATPVGELLLGAYDGALCLCDWKYRRMREAVDARIQRGLNAQYVEGDAPVIERAKQQLNAYFARERKAFDLPLRLVGSDFQQRVWQALMRIPHGRTTTYAELTDGIAARTAIRAVAAANGANALSIIVPCHRVIGSDGALVGYAGGLPAKRGLLVLEGALRQSVPELFDEASFK